MSAEFWVGPHSAPDTFQLVSMLGGGGEGEVWLAVLPLSAGGRRTVAVKIMPGVGGVDEQHRWDRFGHLLRSLAHPGLVRVTDVFTGPDMHRAGTAGREPRLYVVMDHVDGPSLRDWVVENPETRVAERLRMLRMIASALDEMHSGRTTGVPVAHGDVKPANVVVRGDRSTVLVDLGLARLADGAGVSGHSAPYAAPEMRTRGALPTPEADRYAFAVTVAQALTGVAPPLGADGWLDLAALDRQLRAHPLTGRRHRLVQQILDVLTAPSHARPPALRRWLDEAVESLSRLTDEPDPATGAPVLAADRGGRGPALVGAGAAVPETFVPGGQGSPAPGPVAVAPDAVAHPGPARGGPGPAGSGPEPNGRRRRRRGPWVIGLVVVVLGGGAAGVGALYDALPHGSTGTPGFGSGTSGPAAPGASAPDPALGAVAPVAETRFLTDDEPVESDRKTSATASWSATAPAVLNGTRYGHTLTMNLSCGNDDGGDYWVDYATDRRWNRLTATVGLSDDSSASTRGTWTLLADGRTLVDGTLGLGQPKQVDVPVQGVLRLRLKVHDDGALPGACPSGHKTVVVWGEPTLTR